MKQFWEAYALNPHIIGALTGLRGTEALRQVCPPYVLPAGCVGLTSPGGAEYVLREAVTYATTVDSLLAITPGPRKGLQLAELIQALKDNWAGHEVLQARALHKAPKYGRDDDYADALARQVMELWTGETWKYRTQSTGRQFRPGVLSWNYWVADSFILPASPDGRPRGKFLSNALCPSNGAESTARPPTPIRSERSWVARPRTVTGIGVNT
jgi:formate C-acetyltransferase